MLLKVFLAILICPSVENHMMVFWSKPINAHTLLSAVRIFKGSSLAEIHPSFDKHSFAHLALTDAVQVCGDRR